MLKHFAYLVSNSACTIQIHVDASYFVYILYFIKSLGFLFKRSFRTREYWLDHMHLNKKRSFSSDNLNINLLVYLYSKDVSIQIESKFPNPISNNGTERDKEEAHVALKMVVQSLVLLYMHLDLKFIMAQELYIK